MKILKIFGIVVGIHVFALLLIFANPGCSSSGKQPALTDTAPQPASEPNASNATTVTPAPAPVINAAPPASFAFNPDAPAVAAPNFAASSPRQSPTRPNTPVAHAIVDEPVANVAPAETYVVKAGDNLWNIAKKYNVDYKTLATANNLPTSTVLHAGQKLVIPGKVASAPAAKTKGTSAAKSASGAPAASAPVEAAVATSAPKSEGVEHIVQSGESLSVIARRYEVKTGDLALANGITDPKKIKAGMKLVIPGYQATKASSNKNGKSSTKSSAPAPAPKVEAAPPPAIDLNAPAPAAAPAPTSPTFTPPVISIDPSQPPRNP